MFRETWKPSTGDPRDWRTEAACQEFGHEVFFPPAGFTATPAEMAAIRICNRCPVRAECLEWALTHDERYGIWGGQTERERARTKRKAPR